MPRAARWRTTRTCHARTARSRSAKPVAGHVQRLVGVGEQLGGELVEVVLVAVPGVAFGGG
jgi:hypothetical protein